MTPTPDPLKTKHTFGAGHPSISFEERYGFKIEVLPTPDPPQTEAETLIARMGERIAEMHECGDTWFGWRTEDAKAVLALLRTQQAQLTTALRERDEARTKAEHWHRRAQKAEAELCVTAEERARQGMSIGRGLAGATWHHYKDRAEAAERERDEARDDAEYWNLVADGIKHSHECPNNALSSPEVREHRAPCDRCRAEAAEAEAATLRTLVERLEDVAGAGLQEEQRQRAVPRPTG